MHAIIICSIILTIIAFTLSVTSTFTPNWIQQSNSFSDGSSFGFIVLCEYSCTLNAEYLLGPLPVRISFLFMVFSTCFFLLSLALLAIGIVLCKPLLNCLSGVLSIFASAMGVVGVAIYTKISHRDVTRLYFYSYGFSFYLAWCSVGIGLVAGIITIISRYIGNASEVATIQKSNPRDVPASKHEISENIELL